MARLRIMPKSRYTEKTITETDALMKALRKIRKTGIGTDDQEFMHGVVCQAVPVITEDGKCIGGIAISAPEARMTLDEAQAFVPQMKAAAANLASTFFNTSKT